MLNLSLVFNEVLVVLQTKDGERHAVLRELSGRDREDYFRDLQKNVRISTENEDIKSEMKSTSGLSTMLLSRCLFWKNGDGEGSYVRVTDRELLEFPGRVLTELNVEANRLNGFTKESADVAVKN
jgi:hypothetical protein